MTPNKWMKDNIEKKHQINEWKTILEKTPNNWLSDNIEKKTRNKWLKDNAEKDWIMTERQHWKTEQKDTKEK